MRGEKIPAAIMRLLWCVAIWWTAVGVSFARSSGVRAPAEAFDTPAFVATRSARELLLASVVDAEINATRDYVEFLKTKAALLERVIESEQKKEDTATAARRAVNSTQSWHRPFSKFVNERFEDWLPAQGTWHSPPATSGASLHVELISFRPNGNLGNKRSVHANRHHSPHDVTVPTVQFLLIFNKENGLLELVHPTTQALMWHQRLEIPTRVSSVIFHSDRASHLVLITHNDDLLVYKIRVFHSRRLVAGDYRRHSGRERAICNAHVRLPLGFYISRCPRINPLVSPRSAHTVAPIGFHTHIEIEFDVAAKSTRRLSQAAMVASHQSLFLVASSADGYIVIFNGHNGSLVGEVAVPQRKRVAHFQALSSGVVAFTVDNRIHFVDVFDHRLLGITCEGSRHAITSLERDVWRHTILYAGTSDGKALVFRLNRFASIKRNNGLVPIGAEAINPFDESDLGFPSCTLTALLQPRARASDSVIREKPARPAVVTAMPGHMLLATGDGHLVLYDTSSDASIPVYLSERSVLSTQHDPLRARQPFITSVQAGKDPHAGTAAIAVVLEGALSGQPRVELFAARLTPASSALDIGWIRAPMMLFCAFGVMFWQQNRFRRTPSPFDVDLAGLGNGGRKRSRQYGRSGGSDWPRSANHRVFSGR